MFLPYSRSLLSLLVSVLCLFDSALSISCPCAKQIVYPSVKEDLVPPIASLAAPKEKSFSLHPVIALSGGVNVVNLNQSQNLNYTVPGYAPLYENNWQGGAYSAQAITGLFLGIEMPFKMIHQDFGWQFGLTYATYLSPITMSGTTTQGTSAYAPLNQFPYSYNLQSKQLLFDNKLLMTIAKIYHPYLSAGLGIARNDAYHYQTPILALPETGNNPISFGDNTTTSLSYEFGAGLDLDLTFIPHLTGLRFGISYRYVNWGTTSLGAPIPDPYGLGLKVLSTIRLQQSLATQELLAQLTYVFTRPK